MRRRGQQSVADSPKRGQAPEIPPEIPMTHPTRLFGVKCFVAGGAFVLLLGAGASQAFEFFGDEHRPGIKAIEKLEVGRFQWSAWLPDNTQVKWGDDSRGIRQVQYLMPGGMLMAGVVDVRGDRYGAWLEREAGGGFTTTHWARNRRVTVDEFNAISKGKNAPVMIPPKRD